MNRTLRSPRFQPPWQAAVWIWRLFQDRTARAQPQAAKPPNRRQWLSAAARVIAGCCLSGCGRWSTIPDAKGDPFSLRTPQMSPDSVVLEVALLRLGPEAGKESPAESSSPVESAHFASLSTARLDEIWTEVDEQFLPRMLTRRLEQNGFRCGMLDGRPGPALQAALDVHTSRKTLAGDESGTGAPTGIQRLQNRSGRRGKVITSEVRDSLAVLQPEGGLVRGKTYSDAQCLVAVRSFPQGDGQVNLELTPELEHGQARPKWLGEASEGSFRIDTSRDRYEFDDLRISARLGPGQMLVLGPTSAPKGLGRHFFIDTKSGAADPRVLVVRLAQTQLDDLFAPEAGRAPLVSSPD